MTKIVIITNLHVLVTVARLSSW